MPCNSYKSEKQRNLCFATDEWTNWNNIKRGLNYGKRKRKVK
jgi:hypothetical protein